MEDYELDKPIQSHSEHLNKLDALKVLEDIIRLKNEAIKKSAYKLKYNLDEGTKEDPDIVIEKDNADLGVHIKVYSTYILIEGDNEPERLTQITISGSNLKLLQEIKYQDDLLKKEEATDVLLIEHPDYTPYTPAVDKESLN